eukprot:CAMPEP_0115597280 /NCGR_PEP_ID=MMETSP0272-20121206/13268_1 /TAXON_ID=71861 /ORGANISM="Scrippsiella trochoidea, Strain CCMP3099" /LENGTH=63 /DNA_ID=CAMNT_0003032641 /DNA_START=643 /DNA_END=830 /DNA_ORIENTATION=-
MREEGQGFRVVAKFLIQRLQGGEGRATASASEQQPQLRQQSPPAGTAALVLALRHQRWCCRHR